MKEINIWLDDLRTAPEGFIWEKSVEGVMHRIMFSQGNCHISILSLDNDLGENQPEGYKVLDELEMLKFNYPNFSLPDEIRVHSANPVARKRMQQVIDKLYK